MSIADSLLPEFDQEVASTRKVLERVPMEKAEWKPHDKSYTIAQLATHVAQLPGWSEAIVEEDGFDVDPPAGEGQDYTPPKVETRDELLELFDTTIAGTRERIASTSDADFMRPWALLKGGEKLFEVPKIGALRSFVMNHMIHHRGQLTVYLRLNDVPLPQIYGPTADEPDM